MDNLKVDIVKYRAKHNISVAEFAKLCNVSAQTIYSIENGTQTPSRLTRQKIENILEED